MSKFYAAPPVVNFEMSVDTLSYVDSLGLAKHDPNSMYCQNLKTKMDNIRASLDKRWQELEADALKLPQYIGPGEKLYQTRRGHQKIINKEDRRLRDLENQYDDECGGPPPPPAPSSCSDEKKTDVPAWAKVLGAGAAAIGVTVCILSGACGAIVGGAAVISGTAAAMAQ